MYFILNIIRFDGLSLILHSIKKYNKKKQFFQYGASTCEKYCFSLSIYYIFFVK